MRTLVAWLVLSASTVSAQNRDFILPNLFFPPQLKEYLGLSDDQVVRMNNVKAQVFTLQMPKLERQGQLQLEISVETAKAVPDPAVLGPRYVELESIRRALDALQKGLVSQTQAILGSDQKNKLLVLQQAITLYSTACDAVGQNLLSPPIFNFGVTGAIGGQISPSPIQVIPYASFLLGGITQGGCTAAVPRNIFTPQPLATTQP